MKRLSGKFFVTAFRKAAERLLVNKDEINVLNVFPVPDGDTGSNMSAAMMEACEYLDKLNNEDLPSVLEAVKNGMLMGARGNSGVILSQIFRGFAEGVNGKKVIGTKAFSEALMRAKDVAYKSVMKPVEGTMLTVIRVLAEKSNEELGDMEEFGDYFRRLAQIAFDVVEKTPLMLPRLREAGVVDAGGKGLAYIIEGFRMAIEGDTDSGLLTEERAITAGSSAERIVEIAREELRFTYCTELVIKLDNGVEESSATKKLKSFLQEMGDSIVVVNQDDLIKIHVHTDHPGDVIEKFISHGSLQKVKIDNMKLQHEHVVDIQQEREAGLPGSGKKHGIVSVSPGEGLSEIMRSLGADYLVKGGQTMNPSLKDLIEAIHKVRSETVIVLTNNPNILLTAREAANNVMDQFPHKQVTILPTKNIQEGIAALTAYNDILGSDELIAEMEEAIESLISISVTHIIRDSKIKGVKVRKGDYVALDRHDHVLASGRRLEKTVLEAIKKGLNDQEDKEVSTIFYGQEVKEEHAVKLLESLSEEFEELEFEIHYGGQPYYYYLISIE